MPVLTADISHQARLFLAAGICLLLCVLGYRILTLRVGGDIADGCFVC